MFTCQLVHFFHAQQLVISDLWFFPPSDLQIFTFSQKASANFQLIVRLFQGILFLAVVAGVSVAVVLTRLTIGDVFASALAIIPTGWGLLSVSNH